MSLQPLNLPLQGSCLIEASAGTGKTYTIAALYLRLILGLTENDQLPPGGLLPAEILVVTFTEAATKELRERIRGRLTDAARYFRQQQESQDRFLQDLRAGIDSENWPNFARRLELAANWMDEAAVFTIHGWCNRMLQQHAFDSGCLFRQQLNGHNQVLLDQVIRDYWRSFYYPLSLTAGTLGEVYQYFQTPDHLQAALQGLLGEMEVPFSADVPDSIAALCRQHQQQLQQQLQLLKQPWLEWADQIKALLDQAVADKLLPASNYRADLRAGWMQKLKTWAADPQQLTVDIGKGFDNLSPQGLAAKVKDGGQPPQHPGFAAIAALPEQLAALPALKPLLIRHALLWIRQRYSQEKLRLAELGFNDLLLQLDQALAGPQGEKLAQLIRQQFPVALIDEFQDTDPVQYRIFARIYPPEREQGSACLMIGDPKQAIYSFRGADIYTYLKAHRATEGRHYSLDTNFRSSQALVDAVNCLFSRADQQPQGAFLFKQGDDNPLPFVAVKAGSEKPQWLNHGQPASAMTLWHWSAAQPVSLNDYRQHYAEVAASAIVALLNDAETSRTGFWEQAAQRFVALQPGDLAILVRDHREARLMAAALARRQLRSVFLSERDSIYASQEAADVLLWLSALAEPRDEARVRAALSTATLGWRYQQLRVLVEDGALWEQQLERFWLYHQRWLQDGILPALRQLINDYGLHVANASGNASERSLTNLLHLAELLQQASVGLDGEQALIRFLAEAIADQQAQNSDDNILRLESDANLIKIVTIHKSKGLEYPLVLLPFCCDFREVSQNDDFFRYHDQQQRLCLDLDKQPGNLARSDWERLQEDIRLLYVALTRAKFACWLGLAPVKSGAGKQSQLQKSALGYLLGWQAETAASDLPVLLRQLALAEPAIEVQEAPLPDLQPYQPANVAPQTEAPRQAQIRIADDWWIASYSSLPVSDKATPPADEPETAQDSNLADEADQELVASWQADNLYRLPKGAGPGVLVHSLLEQCGRVGFQQFVRETGLPVNLIQQVFSAPFWQDKQPVIAEALQQWLTLPLLPGRPRTLATLAPGAYQVEMEFLLTVKHLDLQQLDQLLQQHLFSGQPRPALLPAQVNGLLKGFIDLVFSDQQQYFLADYKFNSLGLDDQAYQPQALQTVMLAKRYDLQLALYALALHRLLQQRLGEQYDYDRDFGGCLYWFLRGVNSAGQGRLLIRPPRLLIETLDVWFSGGQP